MGKLHDQDIVLRFKQGLAANINVTATKNQAVEGEPHWATDTNQLYIFDGTDNILVGPFDFGNCFGSEIGWTQAAAVQNQWYVVTDADMVDGKLHGITHDGNGQLTAPKAGFYLVDWAGAFEADAANVHVQITLSIDGDVVDDGMNHFETAAVNREETCSGNTILELAAGETVNVAIRTTDAGTPDLLIDHLMIRLVQVGG